MGVNPKIVVFSTQIIHFNRGFHYFHHQFWWFSTYFWVDTHIKPLVSWEVSRTVMCACVSPASSVVAGEPCEPCEFVQGGCEYFWIRMHWICFFHFGWDKFSTKTSNMKEVNIYVLFFALRWFDMLHMDLPLLSAYLISGPLDSYPNKLPSLHRCSFRYRTSIYRPAIDREFSDSEPKRSSCVQVETTWKRQG